jgi:hypothetical protein
VKQAKGLSEFLIRLELLVLLVQAKSTLKLDCERQNIIILKTGHHPPLRKLVSVKVKYEIKKSGLLPAPRNGS